MKRILLPLLFLPGLALAQSANTSPALSNYSHASQYQKPTKEGVLSPVQAQAHKAAPIYNGGSSSQRRPQASTYTTAMTWIGNTVYDLQTNASLAKRLQVYSGNAMSYVWIKSDNKNDANFTIRYTGYNSASNGSWLTKFGNSSAIENDRSGWPNIGAVTVGGNTSELLASHYAAAGSTNYAGGIFWYQNSGIGKTDWTQVIDKSANRSLTNGLLWPRMATVDNMVYMIGTYETGIKKAGVKNPVVFFKYDAAQGKFITSAMTLPGYDSTRYFEGSADEYSLDARGPYVAILIGGYANDLALWKSSDSGKTFTKTVIMNFPHAALASRQDTSVFSDTVVTNDATGSVTLDNNGVAHVSYSPVAITALTGDTTFSFFGINNFGICYWNDQQKQVDTVGKLVDYFHDGNLLGDIPTANSDQGSAGYGHSTCTYSNISFDAQGHIFVVYSAPCEADQSTLGWCFRHVYCSAFDGTKWLAPQDIAQTWQVEDVFATVATEADSKLHFVFMMDDVPGIYIPGNPTSISVNQTVNVDTMVYAEVSTTDILAGKVGLINLGIDNPSVNDLFTLSTVFPNPAKDQLSINMNLKNGSEVNVKLVNMLGQVVEAQNMGMTPAGTNRLQMDLSAVTPGMYMCTVTAGAYSTTKSIMIQR